MALPRLKPLELISRSIGREWALLPPNITFRVELKSLYAAVLRTFCLKPEAIRSMCRWEPRRKHNQPASAEPARAAAPISKTAVPLRVRRTKRSADRTERQWNALAGGACAVGGAAMLAWIVVNHQPEHVAGTVVPTAADARSRTSVQRGAIAQVDASAPGRRDAASVAKNPAASNDHGRTRSPAQPSFDAAARASNDEAAHARPAPSAGSVASRTTTHVEPVHSSKRERPGYADNTARRAPHAAASHRAVQTGADHRGHVAIATTHRARPLSSSAGDYSPFAPSPLARSDYASVTMSAGTHLRNIPTARTAAHVDTNGTEWMNHMSQRRVTEIPDRFSK